MRTNPVIGVLLAAGAGQRLGRGPKALLAFAGEALVVRMARALLGGGCDEVVVVAGAGGGRVEQAMRDAFGHNSGQLCMVVNEAWQTGMGSSFRLGITTAASRITDRFVNHPTDRAAEGTRGLVMVALVDQPDVDDTVVAQLIAQAAPQRVTAAGYPDSTGRLRRGHPLIFPLAMAWDAASMAAGDAAGRVWLRAHPELIDVVHVGHLATGHDLDTPADLNWWSDTVRVMSSTGGTDG